MRIPETAVTAVEDVTHMNEITSARIEELLAVAFTALASDPAVIENGARLLHYRLAAYTPSSHASLEQETADDQDAWREDVRSVLRVCFGIEEEKRT